MVERSLENMTIKHFCSRQMHDDLMIRLLENGFYLSCCLRLERILNFRLDSGRSYDITSRVDYAPESGCGEFAIDIVYDDSQFVSELKNNEGLGCPS